jgi:diketogulonate reductase-like aldo/keto reductase
MDVYMGGGDVEYSPEDARLDIDELISALEEMKEEGATHVVGLSGNYRGAKYQRLGLPEWDA